MMTNKKRKPREYTTVLWLFRYDPLKSIFGVQDIAKHIRNAFLRRARAISL